MLPARGMINARFLYDLTVPRCGVAFPWRNCGGQGLVLGTAGGGVPGGQALERLHPDDRLCLIMIDAPLLCRPILLSACMQAQHPSSVPVLRQELCVQLGGLDSPKGPARVQGRAPCRGAVDDIRHGARAVSQSRGAGQEAVRGHTGTHTCRLSKAREVYGDC